MTVTVRLPADLRPLADGQGDLAAAGATVGDVIADLDERFPGMAERLLDDSGLRRYVNVYVGGSDIRFGDGLATIVPEGCVITILPAIAGG